MSAKRLGLLAAIAVVLVLLAIGLRIAHNPPADNAPRDQPLLPALRDHVNDVSAITLSGTGAKVIATLARGKDGWTIAERSGYPADVSAIRELLVKLGRSTLIEPKTANPQRYPDIGVDDVASKDAKGVLVNIAGLSAPTGLIVGSYSAPAQGTFVRRVGEAQSWLATGDLSVPRTVSDWEKRDVVDIVADRIASVTLTSPEGKAVTLSRAHPGDAAFALDDVPAGRQVDQGVASTVVATLSGLRVDDVFSAKDVPAPDGTYKARYATFDGEEIQAVAWMREGKDYVQFHAALDRAVAQKHLMQAQPGATPAHDSAAKPTAPAGAFATEAKAGSTAAAKSSPPDPQAKLEALDKEVADLDRSFSGWTYVVPAYVYGSMTKTVNDLLQPIKNKKPAAADSRNH